MNPIKPSLKTEFIPLVTMLIVGVLSFYFYSVFPEKVPVHWNIQGEVDNYGSKFFGAFVIPIVMVGMYLLFLLLPYFDPRKKRYQQFAKVYHIFKALIILYMGFIYLLIGLAGMGFDIKIEIWVPILVGILFIIMGNYMSKIKPNWFLGIRTPWTLSAEDNWNKTHRFGAKIFILGGVMMILLPWLPGAWHLITFIIIITLMVFGTIGYSLIYYLANNHDKENNKHE